MVLAQLMGLETSMFWSSLTLQQMALSLSFISKVNYTDV